MKIGFHWTLLVASAFLFWESSGGSYGNNGNQMNYGSSGSNGYVMKQPSGNSYGGGSSYPYSSYTPMQTGSYNGGWSNTGNFGGGANMGYGFKPMMNMGMSYNQPQASTYQNTYKQPSYSPPVQNAYGKSYNPMSAMTTMMNLSKFITSFYYY